MALIEQSTSPPTRVLGCTLAKLDEDIPGSWLPVAAFPCTRCRRLASHSLPRTLEVID